MISALDEARGKRLLLARKMLGFSRKAFNENFDISVNTLQAWESGRNPITDKSARKLSKSFLKAGLLCSNDWLLGKTEDYPTFINKEFLKKAPIHEVGEDKEIFMEIEAFKSINPDPVVIMVTDDMMSPLFKTGDYIGGNKKYKENINNYLGCYCIVENDEGLIFCRSLIKGERKNTYSLLSLNSFSLMYNQKIKFVAEVVWHRKRSTAAG